MSVKKPRKKKWFSQVRDGIVQGTDERLTVVFPDSFINPPARYSTGALGRELQAFKQHTENL